MPRQRLFLRTDLEQQVIEKFEVEMEREKNREFELSLPFYRSITEEKIADSTLPPLLIVEGTNGEQFISEILKKKNDELVLANSQKISMPKDKIDILLRKGKPTRWIEQNYGTVDRFLNRYGYKDENTVSQNNSAEILDQSRSDFVDEKKKTGENSDPPVNSNSSTSTTVTEVERVNRDTAIVGDLKEEYEYRCQVCNDRRFQESLQPYAEGHHIKPLRPDNGPDIKDNIIILCPNHHVDFDYGMIRVDPKSLEIKHRYNSDLNGDTMTVLDWHNISKFLKYHNENIADF